MTVASDEGGKGVAMGRLAIAAALATLISSLLPALAQDASHAVGILVLGNPKPDRFISDFKAGLAEAGYAEGRNLRLVIRSAEGKASRLEELARELVGMKVDVIVPYQTPAAMAAKAATQEIPIVMASVADPVGIGLVRSLAHPGGNITGMSGATSELAAKNVELVKDILPSVRRVAILANEPDPFHRIFIPNVQAAAAQLKIETKVVLARAGEDFDRHLKSVKAWNADAILVQPSLPLDKIADAAAHNKLPAICPNSSFTQAGGLMSYSPDLTSVHRQAATIVDKVLRGRKPSELPVEVTTRFRLAVNLKAASAIGLKLSPLLLTRADEVIE